MAKTNAVLARVSPPTLLAARKDASLVEWAAKINEEYSLAQQDAGTAVQHAVRCGDLLLSVKATLKHGAFEEWVSANCNFALRTARLYMTAARQIGNGLPISSLRGLFPSGDGHNHRALGTGENEWYTPAEYIEIIRAFLGKIDLDPASSDAAQAIVRAGTYYTKERDGLAQEWNGRVFLNPPYTQPDIELFMAKLVMEYKAGRVTEAIALTHNYTDTAWFQATAQSCAALCFTRGRIAFVSPEGKRAAPTQGQAFFYFGERVEEFVRQFAPLGFVMACYKQVAGVR